MKAKLRRKKENDTFRDFGQAIKDYKELFRVIGNSWEKVFPKNCIPNKDFRLVVKQTRPNIYPV